MKNIKKITPLIDLFMGKNYICITLAPFGIYAREPWYSDPSDELKVHENIHWKQQAEMLYVFFYLWYVLEWVIKNWVFRYDDAYVNLSFEREANRYESDKNYLKKRKPFSWIKYL